MRSSITPLINRVGIIRHIRLTNNSIPTSMNTCAAATRFRSFYHTSSAGLSVFDFSRAVPVPGSRLVRMRGLSTAAATVEVEQPRRRRTLKTKDPIVVVSIYIIYIYIYIYILYKERCVWRHYMRNSIVYIWRSFYFTHIYIFFLVLSFCSF